MNYATKGLGCTRTSHFSKSKALFAAWCKAEDMSTGSNQSIPCSHRHPDQIHDDNPFPASEQSQVGGAQTFGDKKWHTPEFQFFLKV